MQEKTRCKEEKKKQRSDGKKGKNKTGLQEKKEEWTARKERRIDCK